MHLSRRVQLQLAFFATMSLIAGSVLAFGFLNLPGMLFGIGQYRVTVDLPRAAGLYPNANVTYRGTEVGRVQDVSLSDEGVHAVLALRSNIAIPADLQAQVHSQSAVGEQFVELVPRSDRGPHLAEGAVIPGDRVTVPPDINSLLTATNQGLQAIPHDNLKTAIDETYTAVGGLGPELSRIVKGSTTLAIDARANLDALTTLIDRSKPVLDTQTDSRDAIQSWAANIDALTSSLRQHDPALRGMLQNGPATFDQVRQLFDRLHPTLPILLSNLVNLADVGVVYQPNIEQLLVLLPVGVATVQGASVANRNTKQDYKGIYLSFNLNVNLPPPCNTGYLPPQQVRAPSEVDYPDRPAGNMYCRVPQDSQLNVRGARNLPCETRPGKRAPTIAMCESDENYVPLNDGYNWKGDPNATITGQPVPQPPIPAAPPPPVAFAQYDPASGSYVGPDGQRYTQTNLAADRLSPPTLHDLMVPPEGPRP
ncbi:virulence factor Mce family protein [Mycobacteroides abscessus subsp. bolletii]|uniref:MCE family protein n=1 Tax=Mycobacteroides abscessus TaxID=36809 RepID=UPI0009A6EEBF|nr:MlaD family protein [Mycobacteroides abscessus]SKG72550.1 virulence factor Mce family protein [Mycobacteroides abscessus subsp. bolletii]SKH10340.1 virulence factor Mce family protein [Mycobacteroides abscessus subsp. bolletii]